MSLQALIEKLKKQSTPTGNPLNLYENFVNVEPREIIKLCEASEELLAAHHDIVWKFKDWSKMQYRSEDAMVKADAIARGEK